MAKVEELAAKIEEARGLRVGSVREVDSALAARCNVVFDTNHYTRKTIAELVGAGNEPKTASLLRKLPVIPPFGACGCRQSHGLYRLFRREACADTLEQAEPYLVRERMFT